MSLPIELAERGWLPDSMIRLGIRRLLEKRLALAKDSATKIGGTRDAVDRFAEELRTSKVTIETVAANAQHYEVPTRFFQLALGQRMKYSCGFWPAGVNTLDDSEQRMLQLTCDRADLRDGMRVLDLGCGWGSLSLWIAEHYPTCQITAISNSHSQREYIEQQCAARQLRNVHVITADIGIYDATHEFDRIISVEMLEHVRNYEQLFARIAAWLATDGLFFAHIFCHRTYAYPFETEGANNWMGRTFFTGGIMPAYDLFHRFQRDLRQTASWWIDGTHYARTCEAWLQHVDQQLPRIVDLLGASSTPETGRRRAQQWRMFFMACAELFAFCGGTEWGVGHFQFERQSNRSATR